MEVEIEKMIPSSPIVLKSLDKFYMITLTNDEGSILSVNKNFLEISKWTPKRVIGKSFWQMLPDTQEGQELAHSIWNQVRGGKTWFGSVEKVDRTDQSYYVNMLAVPFMNEANELISVTFLELDITADVQLREQLQQIAFLDYETGLMSRHKLENIVNEAIQTNGSFSFVYIKIDHYFTLKDIQPYESEKELLKSFTNRLKRFFQDNPIARVGVNEFVVLSPFGDWYVQGFHQFLEQQPIYISNTALPLSVSGGIVRFPEDQQTFNTLMKAAVTATKDVVASGGGKIASLSAASHKELNRKTIIDRKLLIALDHNRLQVVYQPQFDIASGKVSLYEALVRWEDEELGTIMPDELIPIAEENGLIHNIGAFVIEEAAKLGALWESKELPYNISVNSSVREFSDSRMKNKILEILQATGCPTKRLQLEVTENFAFQAEEESSINRQMKELHEIGIEFALDDFGTGYASFRYMQHLPISKIKIDKLFIQSILTQTKTAQLVEGMIHFGKSMGMYVIAEGVETQEQFDLLTSMGIDAVQGHFIGLPISASELIEQ